MVVYMASHPQKNNIDNGKTQPFEDYVSISF